MLWARLLLNPPHRDSRVSVEHSCVYSDPIPETPLYDGKVLSSSVMV